jgi:hypothetical protein
LSDARVAGAGAGAAGAAAPASPECAAVIFLDAAPGERTPPLVVSGTLVTPIPTSRFVDDSGMVHGVVKLEVLAAALADLAGNQGETAASLKNIPFLRAAPLPASFIGALTDARLTDLLSPPVVDKPTSGACGLCARIFPLKKRKLYMHVGLCRLVYAPASDMGAEALASICGCCGRSGKCELSRRKGDGAAVITGCLYKVRVGAVGTAAVAGAAAAGAAAAGAAAAGESDENVPIQCTACVDAGAASSYIWRYNEAAHYEHAHPDEHCPPTPPGRLEQAKAAARGSVPLSGELRAEAASVAPSGASRKRKGVQSAGGGPAKRRNTSGASAGAGAGAGAGTGGGGGGGAAAAAASESDSEGGTGAGGAPAPPLPPPPPVPFNVGDPVMRRNGGGLGTVINVYFAPPAAGAEPQQLAYTVRWDADGVAERDMFHAELQQQPSGKRRAVVNYAALVGRRTTA